MKIGITASWHEEAEKRRRAYEMRREAGFDCIDFQRLCDVNGKLMNADDADFRKELLRDKDEIEAAGLTVSQCHGPWYVDDTSEEKRAKNLAYMKKAVVGTELVNGHYLVVHPVMPYAWAREDDPAWTYELNCAYFTELCDFAADYDVQVCIENMPVDWHTLAFLPSLARLLKDVDRPNFMICYDTGHGNATGEDLEEGMRLCGDKIRTLHIHDNHGKLRDEHMFPFTGTLPWDTFKRHMKQINFAGVYSLECEPSGSLPENVYRDYLRALASTARYLAE